MPPQELESVENSSSRRYGFDSMSQNYKGEDAIELAPKSPVSKEGIVVDLWELWMIRDGGYYSCNIPFLFSYYCELAEE